VERKGAPAVVPGAVHQVEIASRSAAGRGIASLGRRELRVHNALPGELVDVRLEHIGRHLATGRIASVVRASEDRVRDRCWHGEECVGCGLRTTSPDARRRWKTERVVEALAAAGLSDVPVEPTVAAPAEDGWRHKAYLVARRTRKGILLGLFEEGTHHLVSIDGCPAHAMPVERVLAGIRRALRDADARKRLSIYDERARRGWLRAIAVRASSADGSAVVTLVTTDEPHEGTRALAMEMQRESPTIVGIVTNLHVEPTNAPFGPTFQPLLGRPHIEEPSGEFTLRVSAGSFFQVNPAVGAAIHDRVRSLARSAPPGPALDLYGGVGAMAVRLAADGRSVTLVEAPGSAAVDAAWNLREVAGARVVAGRVEDEITALVAERPAVIVVNPPRSGLSAPVVTAIAASRSPLVLYVSCDPQTLSRDLARLGANGHVVTSVVPFDLMPQTPHVEALAAIGLAT
jgi:23S rRNA (uracil-5-)-methyltransferase RumA